MGEAITRRMSPKLYLSYNMSIAWITSEYVWITSKVPEASINTISLNPGSSFALALYPWPRSMAAAKQRRAQLQEQLQATVFIFRACKSMSGSCGVGVGLTTIYLYSINSWRDHTYGLCLN